MEMFTLDIGYRPLGRIWSCRHLLPLRHAETEGWYASCVVGDANDRQGWARAVGFERLRKIEGLRQELASVTAPLVERLWRWKRRQLALLEAGRDATSETSRLRLATDRVVARVDLLLRQRAALLEELHLPAEACHALIRLALDRLVTQRSSDPQLDVPDEVLARFPADMRLFFRPPGATKLSR